MRDGEHKRASAEGHNTALSGPASENRMRPPDIADYAVEVKRLTNYEVWKNVESTLSALAPGQEPEGSQWWALKILLDELRWRLSGLEGAGSATVGIPMHIHPN